MYVTPMFSRLSAWSDRPPRPMSIAETSEVDVIWPLTSVEVSRNLLWRLDYPLELPGR